MKILIIRYKFIGDVLLTSTLCSSLKASFPDSKIDYLVYAASAAILENHPGIDQVIGLSAQERENPFKYLKRIWSISRADYDLIIDATSTARTEMISLFARGAKYRIGRYKKGRGFAYTHTVKKFPGDKIQERVAMLQPLIDDGYTIVTDEQIKIELTDHERATAKSKLLKQGVDLARPIFGFSVSSKLDYRMWNHENMKQVAEHCLDEHGAQLVLLPGMAHEQEIVAQFARNLGRNEGVFAEVSARSLRELVAILSQCTLYVGNEGGPRHFAEAVGTPTVCVFSPSADRAEWLKANRSEHRAVEWRDVLEFDTEPNYEFGDDTYYRLYNAIKPEHVIDLVDQVVRDQQLI